MVNGDPMMKQVLLLTSLHCLSAVAAGADDVDMEQVEAAIIAAVHEAAVDSKVISSGDLTATLDTYDNVPGKHAFADSLGLTGGTSATISRNHKPLVVMMPGDGSYSIIVLNPNNKEEVIANISVDTSTGHLTHISYFGRSKTGDRIDAIDGNVDGQPETIIVYDREGMSRIWLRDAWRQVVKQNGNVGVILDGEWHRVRRDPESKQWDLFDTPESSDE
jgi:hypothetical protein